MILRFLIIEYIKYWIPLDIIRIEPDLEGKNPLYGCIAGVLDCQEKATSLTEPYNMGFKQGINEKESLLLYT